MRVCESNEKVVNECVKLKRCAVIHDFFIRNGFVKIVKKEGDRPIKIKHPDILYDLFSDEYYGYEDLYMS